MRLTKKQKIILREICEGNRDKYDKWVSWCDQRQICDRVSYEPSKDAMKCSVRFLVNKKMVIKAPLEKRRTSWVAPLVPTELALEKFGRGNSPRRFSESLDGITDYY
jgi:hypothetical protein